MCSIVAAATVKGKVSLFGNDPNPDSDIQRGMIPNPVRGTNAGGLGHAGGVSCMEFLEEHVLVTGAFDRAVKVWDCTNLTRSVEVISLVFPEGVTSLATTSGSSALIVVGLMGGNLSVRDLRSSSGASDVSVKASPDRAALKQIEFCDEYKIITGDTRGRIGVRDIRFLKQDPLLTLLGSSTCSCLIPHIQRKAKFSPVQTVPTPPIDESVWEIAMGKVAAPKKSRSNNAASGPKPARPIEDVATKRMGAHESEILAIGMIRSNVIVSLAADSSLKLFCLVTGKQLHAEVTPEKPTVASFANSQLLFGTREGFSIYGIEPRGNRVNRILNNNTTHVGGVVSTCHVGDWAICTGGSDRHIFIHRLDHSIA
jgi:hypothetical protein